MKTMFVACLVLVAAVAVATARAKPEPVVLDGLASTPPAEWEEKPSSGMRFKQWSLPEQTEVVIFHFGPGQGGSAADNVKRWTGMFEKAEPVVTEEKVAGAKVTLVELSGTYLYKARPMEPTAERRENHRMIGVVFETPKGPYFMRLVGPDASVKKHKPGCLRWLRGFEKK